METVSLKTVRSSRRRGPNWITATLLLLALLFAASGSARAAETVTYYYYTNPQGTVLATADSAGTIISSSDYRPYGTRALGAPEAGPGYTGHVNDVDTGLVYMQARYYNPDIGRFSSTDQKRGEAGDLYSFNRYSYVGNNPTSKTDPDGNQCAQCLYYPGDIEHQARINQAASGQALEMSIGLIPVVGAAQGVGIAIANPTALNIAAAVIGLVPEAGGAIGSAARGVSAAERASALAATLSGRTARGTTIAVTETAEGTRVVSSSEGYLRKTTQAALEPGEAYGKGVPRMHAEVNGVNAAREMGLTPTGTAASRPICPSCVQTLDREGIDTLSPLK